MDEMKEKVRAQYGVNKIITGDDYDESLAVKCINGTFVGKRKENIFMYKGIPYVGKQPVGDLRWKAPVDCVADDGVYEAYYYAKCSYGNEDLEDGSLYFPGEDCLYLNVWKADKSVDEKKPVMVWIHGGAYEAGGTADLEFDMVNFLKENPDVIVVTVAYRLGVFGFLHLSHLPDGKAFPDSQNLGLLDQMMALKWIHENIACFGGDPDNVTIWGESAGAGSVTLLPLIEGSQKYFNRVIAQSGSPSLTRSSEDSIECTNNLIEAIGCKSVEELNKLDSESLFEASAIIRLRSGPERDGIHLPLNPHEAYEKGVAKDIDFLQGCNKDEMNFFRHGFGEEYFKMWIDDRKARGLAKLPDEDKQLIKSFCNDVEGDDIERYVRIYDQIWFNAPVIRMSENQTKAGGRSYTYYFIAETSVPGLKSGHAVELPALFNHPELTEDDGKPFDETFSRTMRKMWVQFAKTGNPSLTADISPDGKAKEWPLYDLENKKVMVLDESDIHPEKESERNIVDWQRTYFLTKYYWL